MVYADRDAQARSPSTGARGASAAVIVVIVCRSVLLSGGPRAGTAAFVFAQADHASLLAVAAGYRSDVVRVVSIRLIYIVALAMLAAAIVAWFRRSRPRTPGHSDCKDCRRRGSRIQIGRLWTLVIVRKSRSRTSSTAIFQAWRARFAPAMPLCDPGIPDGAHRLVARHLRVIDAGEREFRGRLPSLRRSSAGSAPIRVTASRFMASGDARGGRRVDGSAASARAG